MRYGRSLLYLLIPAFALATVSIAQDAQSDDPPSMENSGPVDAQELLGDRAKTPDQREDAGPPEGLQQGENAGSLSTTVPMESRSSTTTVTEESSSSVTFGQTDPVPGDIANRPPPPSGWPGSKHANRPNQSGWGPVTVLDAGPIWNNDDAQGKCARTCGNANMGWTGEWKTVGFNKSVCSCATGGRGPGWAGGGRGTSCSVPSNYQCTGCSVSCPADKAASCTQGDRGIFTGESDRICAKDAKCQCV